MKVDTKKIEWLLTHATAYQIGKLSGVAQPAVTRLVNGTRKIEKASIETGYKLTKTAEYMQTEILKHNEMLISEVLEDISLFGEDFEVFAVKIQDDFINDYVHATPPTRQEFPDEEDFNEVMADYQKNLASLVGEDREKMTIGELLKKLERQRFFFK